MDEKKFDILVDFLEILRSRKDVGEAISTVADKCNLTYSQKIRMMKMRKKNGAIQKYRQRIMDLREPHPNNSVHYSVNDYIF